MDEIKTVPFIIDIPESTIMLEINVEMLIGGEVKAATMSIADAGIIRRQMIKGEEYEDEYGQWMLTDEAKEQLGIGKDVIM